MRTLRGYKNPQKNNLQLEPNYVFISPLQVIFDKCYLVSAFKSNNSLCYKVPSNNQPSIALKINFSAYPSTWRQSS